MFSDRDFGDNETVFDVWLLGNSRSGKSAFQQRCKYNYFKGNYDSTIGISFDDLVVTVPAPSPTVKLKVTEVGGSEFSRRVAVTNAWGASAALIFVDMSDPLLFQGLDEHITNFRRATLYDEGAIHRIPIVLVGTKLDLVAPDKIKEIEDSFSTLCREKELLYFETISAKEGDKAIRLITVVAQICYLNRHVVEAKYEADYHKLVSAFATIYKAFTKAELGLSQAKMSILPQEARYPSKKEFWGFLQSYARIYPTSRTAIVLPLAKKYIRACNADNPELVTAMVTELLRGNSLLKRTQSFFGSARNLLSRGTEGYSLEATFRQRVNDALRAAENKPVPKDEMRLT